MEEVKYLKYGVHFVSQATTKEEAYKDFVKAMSKCGHPMDLVNCIEFEEVVVRKENEDKG